MKVDSVRPVGLQPELGQLRQAGQQSVTGSKEGHGGVKQEQYSRDDMANSVDLLNEAMDHVNKRLSFQLHEDTERVVVRVLDSFTGDVIKQIPPEEVLDVSGRIQQLVGLLVDEWT